MGQLVETEKKEMSGDVACLDVGPVPEGRQRSRFLAVGSYDNTVPTIKHAFCVWRLQQHDVQLLDIRLA